MSPVETKYVDLTLKGAIAAAGSDDDMTLAKSLESRLAGIATEMTTFRALADRFDALYYPTTIGPWGADLWADDPSVTTPGRAHVSVNTGGPYVDIPAAMQALEAVENMMATKNIEEARSAAESLERMRTAWKVQQ